MPEKIMRVGGKVSQWSHTPRKVGAIPIPAIRPKGTAQGLTGWSAVQPVLPPPRLVRPDRQHTKTPLFDPYVYKYVVGQLCTHRIMALRGLCNPFILVRIQLGALLHL